MSESFRQQIVFQMQGGTPRGDCHLCPSCNGATIRRGVNGSQDLQICNFISQVTGGRRGIINGPVARCTSYYPRNLPQLHELQEIAWELSFNNRKIGFITPEDRRRAGIGFGQAPPPCTRPG